MALQSKYKQARDQLKKELCEENCIALSRAIFNVIPIMFEKRRSNERLALKSLLGDVVLHQLSIAGEKKIHPLASDKTTVFIIIRLSEWKKYGFNDKDTAHRTLGKCLEYLRSKPELQSIAVNIMETLEDKKILNDFWASKKCEEKKENLKKRRQVAEERSKLYDAEQHATMKEIIYRQDNNVRENFNVEIIKKGGRVQETEKKQQMSSTPNSRKRKSDNLSENNENFKMRLLGYRQSENEFEDDKSDEDETEDVTSDEEDVINFSTISFDQFTESSKGEEIWTLKNGESVRNTLIRMTSEAIKKAKEIQSKKKKLNASISSTIRLGLSSIVDLSSEFSGGMYSWFGGEWPDLKAKALAKINIKPKMFEDLIKSDIEKIEELCNEHKYWEARDFVYEKLKGRPDRTETFHRQVMKIYFFIIEMFLVDPYVFVDREGNKQNLTEIEFTLKVAGPIIDIIFSDVQHLVQLKWGETVSKATTVGRKIDLKIMYRGKNQGKNVELSHSECARRTNSTKIINDRSKCLRTNKSVLDQYLSHDLSDEIIENSAVIGLQLAALYGQIIGVDLLDEGLYFGFEGPLLRFPTQINDITVLKQTLEALYFFKENIVHKAEALSCLNKNSDPFSNTFHTERISKSRHYKANFIRSTYFTVIIQ
ncbi:18643_t:CDS:10 [Funneliformis geosporum]|uniref:18643_t:CDS:1 n=1 Tax=Funneliformis geosporum TaxID=1117311 RepID=A0A9W4SU91_9GLOM|nr:18643_t:CDS:10 [Funneliformis geosporum]